MASNSQLLSLASVFESIAKQKGWTEKSKKQYADTMMEGEKHPFAECVKKMKGKVDSPEGFCAKTKDRFKGDTKWRSEEQAKNKKKKSADEFEASLKSIGHNIFVEAKKGGDGKVKARNRPSPVFDAKHPKVKDNKDHFPLGTENQARNALARASQFSSSPEWYSGSLSELVNAVRRAVKSKYPGIEVSDKSKKPGKG